MLEFLIELLGEFLLQAFAEVFVELGLHIVSEPFRKPRNPWVAAVAYAIFGATVGGLSLLVFPRHFIPVGSWRFVNLFATPVGVGSMMAALGARRLKRGDPILRIDRFWYGFLFAVSMALVRFHFAKDG